MTRRRRVEAVSLEWVDDFPSDTDAPEQHAERGDARAHVLRAVAELPEFHREVLTLYYLREYSQREIADFLGVPVTTVNGRLHAARAALRDRILGLVREALRAGALPQDFPERVARTIGAWQRVREAERFGVWPSLSPAALTPHLPDGFRPHRDPNRCGCRRLAWPCPRCARLEGVEAVPPPLGPDPG
jgi:hypothetical protein